MNREINSIQKSNLNEEQSSNIPVRRYFARWLDGLIYSTIWSLFLTVVMKINVLDSSKGRIIFDIVVGMVLMLLIEPALLSAFGTTIGKWILGIRITDRNGRRLSYAKGFSRVAVMLWKGKGLRIPIYDAVRLWKSFHDCKDGKTLEWEYDSVIHLKDQRKWRIGAYIGACIAVFGVTVFGIAIAKMPENRGDITVAQFCENYNKFAEYYKLQENYRLDQTGKWIKLDSSSYVIGEEDPIEMNFTEENGIMTGLNFSIHVQDGRTIVSSYQEERILSILAFVQAQPSCSLIFNEADGMVWKIQKSPFENFEWEECGVKVTCTIKPLGYLEIENMGILYRDEEVEGEYSFEFSMEKEE